MKKSNLKLVFSLLLLAVVIAAVFSCNKTNLPPDPNDSIVVKREIVVSALDVFTKDSIAQFNVTVVSPTATSSQVTTGKTYVIKDPVAGTYKITVTKTGYADPTTMTYSVVLPTDPKASMVLAASVLMTKAAAAVTVTGTTGAVIAVKTNSSDAGSTAVAAVTVAPGTVFTLADGSKPATVAISASNVPLASDNAPIASIGGVNTVVLDKPVEVINNQVASQKIDLQPTGLVLSQPMTIDMYIGNDYPATMSVAEKTARQAGLTLNYVRKDGTVEVVTPDRFSADRNTVYYKISHFSQWGQTNSNVSLTESKAAFLSPPQTNSTLCGGGTQYTFSYSIPLTPIQTWLLTGRSSSSASYKAIVMGIEARAGYVGRGTVVFNGTTYDLVDKTPGFGSTSKVTFLNSGILTIEYIVCHQQ